ncbi:hypothetical protein [Rhodococcus koreensis]
MSVAIRVSAEPNDFAAARRAVHGAAPAVSPPPDGHGHRRGGGHPHAAIDLVLVNGESVDFGHRARTSARITAYSLFATLDIGG